MVKPFGHGVDDRVEEVGVGDVRLHGDLVVDGVAGDCLADRRRLRHVVRSAVDRHRERPDVARGRRRCAEDRRCRTRCRRAPTAGRSHVDAHVVGLPRRDRPGRTHHVAVAGVAGHGPGRQGVVVRLGGGAFPVLDEHPPGALLRDPGCRSARGCSPSPTRRPRSRGLASSRCRRTCRGRASRPRGSRPPGGWRRAHVDEVDGDLARSS